jgi:hypothetical protein
VRLCRLRYGGRRLLRPALDKAIRNYRVKDSLVPNDATSGDAARQYAVSASPVEKEASTRGSAVKRDSAATRGSAVTTDSAATRNGAAPRDSAVTTDGAVTRDDEGG